MLSSANKIEGGWLGTGREGRGTEVGKEGGRQITLERDRNIVWRKGGRDAGRERSKARVEIHALRAHFGNGERDRGRERARETAKDSISTRREVVEFLWDTQNTQTLPY